MDTLGEISGSDSEGEHEEEPKAGFRGYKEEESAGC